MLDVIECETGLIAGSENQNLQSLLVDFPEEEIKEGNTGLRFKIVLEIDIKKTLCLRRRVPSV